MLLSTTCTAAHWPLGVQLSMILGAHSSGKSTLLHILAGDRGNVSGDKNVLGHVSMLNPDDGYCLIHERVFIYFNVQTLMHLLDREGK